VSPALVRRRPAGWLLICPNAKSLSTPTPPFVHWRASRQWHPAAFAKVESLERITPE
jgi:hypothetical protein